MSKTTMPTASMNNRPEPQSAELDADLRDAAARAAPTANELACKDTQQRLRGELRQRKRAELASFVQANAGGAFDTHGEWEAASAETFANASYQSAVAT